MTVRRHEIMGLHLFSIKCFEDDRGLLLKTFNRGEFAFLDDFGDIRQIIVADTKSKNTLRGLHFQADPKQEAKLITCLQGAIFGVVVDLRLRSKTFQKWVSYDLTFQGVNSIYVPRGFAHGYLTTTDNVKMIYHLDQEYYPELQVGVRWDDHELNIPWPTTNPNISARDKKLKSLREILGHIEK